MDLNEVMNSLFEISKCPVCFERLSTPAVCCVNGHAICERCKRTQNQCPTCRGQFSAEKHTHLSQLLEAIPHQCKFEGCSEIMMVTQAKEHEKWCVFRPARCHKDCSWSGPLNKLTEHVINNHNLSDQAESRGLARNKITDNYYVTYAHFIQDKLLWRTIEYNNTKERLSLRFTCVPFVRPEVDSIQIKIEFMSDRVEYAAKLKVPIEPEVNRALQENTLSFSRDILEPFIDNNRNLLSYCMKIQQN